MNEYQPLFMEETLLVHIYGSDEEISRFDELMNAVDDEETLVEITILIEDIKRRNVSKMDWNCCHRCDNYRMCKINWARGERDIPRNCCSLCPNYEDCRARRRRFDAEGGECVAAAPPQVPPPAAEVPAAEALPADAPPADPLPPPAAPAYPPAEPLIP